jgi:NAD(P)-dependent dehydrogenase (short-subunit alcohol dehydrogenase family)
LKTRNRAFVVSGAVVGLGEAISLELAAAGARLAIFNVRVWEV